MTRDRFDFEEEFHSRDRKVSRKERKHLKEGDRSKYKKTDQIESKQVVDERLARGRVIAITGEGTWVESGAVRYLCSVKGLLKKEKVLQKNIAATGDYVRFEATSEKEAVICQIEDRFSTLSRTDISGRKEQLIAANVDQAFIVASLVEPGLRPALIDRYLIACERGNIHPIIAINKVDLLENNPDEEERYQEFLRAYEPLGFPILSLSTTTGVGLDAVRSLMKDKTSVVTGQSGVGKSSLLNAAFQMDLRTGDLAVKTSKGTHTTTTAQLLPLPDGGYCVDTPGIRSFGVWKLDRREIFDHFRDIAQFGKRCKFADCTHTTEPSCAVLKALKEGKLPLMRYESFASLLDDALGGIDNRTRRLMEQENE